VTKAPILFFTWPSPDGRDRWHLDSPDVLAAAEHRKISSSALAIMPAWPETVMAALVAAHADHPEFARDLLIVRGALTRLDQ
jgi:hypothetical protein